MDNMRELKPCPFCGGPVELEKTIDGRAWYGVVCRNTFNRGGTCAVSIRPSASEECAIERWNMRAQSAAVPELPDPTTDDLALFERVVGPYGYAGSFERNAIDLYANSQTHNCHNGWQHAMQYMKSQQSVPVAGEVVGWITSAGYHFWPSDKVKNPDNFVASGMRPLIVKPTTSISAAELDALRKDAERGRLLIEHGEWIRRNHDTDEAYAMLAIRLPYSADLSCNPMREYAIDAAIAGEKNHG